jgi:hypothetical protein
LSLQVVSSFARRVAVDLGTARHPVGDPQRHLREAEAWLERAHDACGDGGVSYGWSLRGGWKPSYRETQDLAFLAAATRAGRWLVTVADADRRWTRHEHFGTPHVYNTRTAWALLQLDGVARDPDFVAVARANLDWAVAEQRDGYFRHCSFKPGVPPYTHTIAYTIRGLLESGRLLGDARYVESAASAARAMREHLRDDGFIAGQVDEEGRDRASYCCLTGNCQLAIAWAKLHESTGDEAWRRAAIRALDYVMSCQDVETDDLNVRGAIAGSHPIWGRYAPLSYPNWATKFFVDAMILRTRWTP